MARIRSVHPGLFTDEAFVSCSPLARLLFIGLWTEADDGGIFEWKPITIKMRLMPIDNVGVAELLEELSVANMVRRYTAGGREYGAVRNFCRFQRPKKPKSTHPMPPEFRTYVGSDDQSSEPDEAETPSGGEPEHHQLSVVPKRTEKPPQMEEGGWRREDGGGNASAAARAQSPLEVECRRLVGQEPCLVDPDFSPVTSLLDEGLIVDDIRTGIVEGLAKARSGYRFRSWHDFQKWIRTAAKNRLAGKPRSTVTASPPKLDDPDVPRVDFGCGTIWPETSVRRAVDSWRRNPSSWPDILGEPPGRPGCKVPERLLEEGVAA